MHFYDFLQHIRIDKRKGHRGEWESNIKIKKQMVRKEKMRMRKRNMWNGNKTQKERVRGLKAGIRIDNLWLSAQNIWQACKFSRWMDQPDINKALYFSITHKHRGPMMPMSQGHIRHFAMPMPHKLHGKFAPKIFSTGLYNLAKCVYCLSKTCHKTITWQQ